MEAPCTPSTRDLLGRVQNMNLNERRSSASSAVADACNAALAVMANDHGDKIMSPAPPPPPQGNDMDDLGFQTPPAALRRRKLSFVVTPPRIEKKSSDFGGNNDADTVAAATATTEQPSLPLLSQEEDTTAPSLCRKRVRAPPPMLPGSPEFASAASSMLNDADGSSTDSIGSVFRRHVPMHSPIAGLTSSVVNVEFMAKFLAEAQEDDEEVEASIHHHHQQGQVDPQRIAVYPRRDSFLAKHSFPILDEAEGDTSLDTANEQPVQGLMLPRALKMRKTSRENLENLLQAERELFSS